MPVYRKHNSINSAQHKSTYATREPVKQPAQIIKPIACNSTLSVFPNPYYLKTAKQKTSSVIKLLETGHAMLGTLLDIQA